MKRSTIIVCVALLGIATGLAQTPPDSTWHSGPPLPPGAPQVQPAAPLPQNPPVPAPAAPRPAPAPPRIPAATPAAPAKPEPPAERPKPATPVIAVLDFTANCGVPASLLKTMPERLRCALLNSGRFGAVDAGETWNAAKELKIARPDSITREQVAALAKKTGAAYVLGCVVMNYREGDLEQNKHSVELLGKLFDGGTGQLLHMETVKNRGKGEVSGLVTQGIDKLAVKMIERIRK